MTQDTTLPPLPHPAANILIGDDWHDVFTADQLRAYALAALAAADSIPDSGEAVAKPNFISRWTDVIREMPSTYEHPAAPRPTTPAAACSDERPCLPCYTDQGECKAPAASGVAAEALARDLFEARRELSGRLPWKRGGSVFAEAVPEDDYVDPGVQRDWLLWLEAWKASQADTQQPEPSSTTSAAGEDAQAVEAVTWRGRWTTDAIGANLYCDCFSADLKLMISGDFEDAEARKDCADELVRVLNRSTPTQEGGQAMPSDPSAIPADAMSEALAAGDGTLHGAITYWQSRALAAEASRDVDETNKVLADNYLRLDSAIPAAVSADLAPDLAQALSEDWMELASEGVPQGAAVSREPLTELGINGSRCGTKGTSGS